jgi:hypothetical protein
MDNIRVVIGNNKSVNATRLHLQIILQHAPLSYLYTTMVDKRRQTVVLQRHVLGRNTSSLITRHIAVINRLSLLSRRLLSTSLAFLLVCRCPTLSKCRICITGLHIFCVCSHVKHINRNGQLSGGTEENNLHILHHVVEYETRKSE